MGFQERPNLKTVEGTFPVEYQYTAGLAGERFLREIKDNGRILASRCNHCNLAYLPPRLYCERCFGELGEWVEVRPEGSVLTYAILYYDALGNSLSKPEVLALVRFEGIHGGLIHKVKVASPEELFIGMPVKAVLKPKGLRVGSILDIEYFEPTLSPEMRR